MTHPRGNFFRIHQRTLLALLFGLAFSATLAYAVPPTTPYNPAETLDPSCAPGDTNCSVIIFPDQTGHAGEFLTTDGTNVSWDTVASGTTYTFSTGLTNSADTITNNLSTGVSGGQSVIGGTASGNNLTLSSTSHVTKGKILFGTSAYDEVNNRLGIGTATPATKLDVRVTAPQMAAIQVTNGTDTYFAVNAVVADSHFVGLSAGQSATNAYTSNFFGYRTGYQATNASDSNFFGYDAGYQATNAATSNFFGLRAGKSATDAVTSNFFGSDAGYEATYATLSNFIGQATGYQASNAANSNFIGYFAGAYATNAATSNFHGRYAGFQATNASYSNFFGSNAGTRATNASNSNFFGSDAGYEATTAKNSIFIGQSAGLNDTVNNTTDGDDFSILIGKDTLTGGFENSIAIGGSATNTASYQFMLGSSIRPINQFVINGTNPSVIGGTTASNNLTLSSTSHATKGKLLFGTSTYDEVNNRLGLGQTTPTSKLDITATVNATPDNTLGIKLVNGIAATVGTQQYSPSIYWKGEGWTGVGSISKALEFRAHIITTSNPGGSGVQGSWVLQSAQNGGAFTNVLAIDNGGGAAFSGSLGVNSALNVSGATGINGNLTLSGSSGTAGQVLTSSGGGVPTWTTPLVGSTSTTGSLSETWLGTSVGNMGSAASEETVFIGSAAGFDATNAIHAIFVGYSAGSTAIDAANSVFIGYKSGNNATTASNSIFIGKNAGDTDTVDNTADPDDFSVLIGKGTSTGGFSNSIAIGGSATNTAVNQFMIGSTVRPIDETRIEGTGGTECTITTGTGIACTSDERLKTNIRDLEDDILSKVREVDTITFNWLGTPDSNNQIGFIAQNLEPLFPELVDTDLNGYKSVYYAQMTPVLVKAVQELDIKVETLSNFEDNDLDSFAGKLREWFASTTNGIARFFAKEVETQNLCVSDESGAKTCVTKTQLDALLETIDQEPHEDIEPDLEPEEETQEDQDDSTTEDDENSDTGDIDEGEEDITDEGGDTAPEPAVEPADGSQESI